MLPVIADDIPFLVILYELDFGRYVQDWISRRTKCHIIEKRSVLVSVLIIFVGLLGGGMCVI